MPPSYKYRSLNIKQQSINQWWFDIYYTPTHREGAILQSPCPSVHTFVTDIAASTGRNDLIFDIWLWHGDLYRVSPFQVYRISTSCLQCNLEFFMFVYMYIVSLKRFTYNYTPALPEGGILFYLCPFVQDIFRRIFLSNYWWQKSDIWSQASYRYAILWEAFLDPSDSYFLFADLVGFYTHWTYMREYHKWALAHSSSCCASFLQGKVFLFLFQFPLQYPMTIQTCHC